MKPQLPNRGYFQCISLLGAEGVPQKFGFDFEFIGNFTFTWRYAV